MKKNRGLNAQEKRRVAFHESGHTLVAESVPTGEEVEAIIGRIKETADQSQERTT